LFSKRAERVATCHRPVTFAPFFGAVFGLLGSGMADLQAKKRKHAAGDRWVIQGYDGVKPLARTILPKSRWPEPRVTVLLQRLVSKNLEVSDIIDASRPPRDTFHNPVLREKRSEVAGRLTIKVGENPYYVASLWKADEKDG